MSLINFIGWIPEILRIAKFVVDNFILIKTMEKTIKTDDINKLYQDEIFKVSEMLKYNSNEALQKIYDSFVIKINIGNYSISEKIVFEAVKKLLNTS